jgi:hypothetical protein
MLTDILALLFCGYHSITPYAPTTAAFDVMHCRRSLPFSLLPNSPACPKVPAAAGHILSGVWATPSGSCFLMKRRLHSLLAVSPDAPWILSSPWRTLSRSHRHETITLCSFDNWTALPLVPFRFHTGHFGSSSNSTAADNIFMCRPHSNLV